ncbi:MAG TPA: M15 family metallopeptidase [Acidimicrobiales bacterium]|nr:M15 family metallopeptidase [Acidimicrobiales bacterium]
MRPADRSPRSHLLLAGRPAVIAAAFLLPLAVPTGAGALGGPAINPSNKPTPVPGATNGELPASDLIGVAPHCTAYRAAAPSLGLLLATARDEGVSLGTDQCYRSLAGEQAASAQWTAAGNSACAAPVTTSPTGQPTGTSMHGWGKAVDFNTGTFDAALGFGDPQYAWLAANAGDFGWNRPGWAMPGGSACPEAWHFEWVGDGGVQGDPPIRADVVSLLPAPGGLGYTILTGLGATEVRGAAVDHGSAASMNLAQLVVGGAGDATGGGYWMTATDGGVFSFGDAGFHGSMGGKPLAAPMVGMAATPDSGGYLLAGADGGVFTFGDATFHGSAGGLRLARPVVAVNSSVDGGGYRLAASDGGVFCYGDAGFFGSMGGQRLAAPIVGMASTPDGGGYWLVGDDGGVFAFGDAHFYGSMAGKSLNAPVVGMSASPDGRGYLLVGADGGVFSFGDAGFYGAG